MLIAGLLLYSTTAVCLDAATVKHIIISNFGAVVRAWCVALRCFTGRCERVAQWQTCSSTKFEILCSVSNRRMPSEQNGQPQWSIKG